MSFSATVTRSVSSQGTSITNSTTHTGEQRLQIAEAVAAGATDVEIIAAIDVSALKMIALRATVDMTIDTNDSTTPQETIELTANKPVIFEDGDAALLSGDVTSLFVSNAGADAGVLTVIAIMDL